MATWIRRALDANRRERMVGASAERDSGEIFRALRGGAASTVVRAGWTPPIHTCVATRGEGVTEIVASLEKHRTWLDSSAEGRERRHVRLSEEVREALRETLIDEASRALALEIEDAVRGVETRALDPYTATEQLVTRFRAR